jgi:hypothetical protein
MRVLLLLVEFPLVLVDMLTGLCESEDRQSESSDAEAMRD